MLGLKSKERRFQHDLWQELCLYKHNTKSVKVFSILFFLTCICHLEMYKFFQALKSSFQILLHFLIKFYCF